MNLAYKQYVSNLTKALDQDISIGLEILCSELLRVWKEGANVFIIGNGGSAANAIHLANDFIYGAGKSLGKGLRVEALSANSAVITCLGNDTGYDNIFSKQLEVKGAKGDIVIALSGSGNSPNINKAILVANDMGMHTFAILGFDGGQSLKISKTAIHFNVMDMQISEDIQLIVGHICMQWLSKQSFREQ